MYNIYCFSTAAVVARTRLNVTLYLHYMSCFAKCLDYWKLLFCWFWSHLTLPLLLLSDSSLDPLDLFLSYLHLRPPNPWFSIVSGFSTSVLGGYFFSSTPQRLNLEDQVSCHWQHSRNFFVMSGPTSSYAVAGMVWGSLSQASLSTPYKTCLQRGAGAV